MRGRFNIKYMVIWLNVFFGALFTYFFGMRFAIYSLVALNIMLLMASCVRVNVGGKKTAKFQNGEVIYNPAYDVSKTDYERNPPDVPMHMLGLPVEVERQAREQQFGLKKHEAATFRGSVAAYKAHKESDSKRNLLHNAFDQFKLKTSETAADKRVTAGAVAAPRSASIVREAAHKDMETTHKEPEVRHKLMDDSFDQRLVREKHKDQSIQQEIDWLLSEA